MLKWIVFLLLFIPFTASSSDDALSLDRVVPQDFELAFPNDNNIQPDISDFEVLNVALMSAGQLLPLTTMRMDVEHLVISILWLL